MRPSRAGIGANTSVFSLANAVLLRPLQFEDPTAEPTALKAMAVRFQWAALRANLIPMRGG